MDHYKKTQSNQLKKIYIPISNHSLILTFFRLLFITYCHLRAQTIFRHHPLASLHLRFQAYYCCIDSQLSYHLDCPQWQLQGMFKHCTGQVGSTLKVSDNSMFDQGKHNDNVLHSYDMS